MIRIRIRETALRNELNAILPFCWLAGVGGVLKEGDNLRQSAVRAEHKYTGRMSAGGQMIRQMIRHGIGIVSDEDTLLAFGLRQ